MTKPLNTQNEWIILMLIGAVAGFCFVSLDVVKCTLSFHAEGPCASPGRWYISIWSRGAISHLVVHIDFE